MPRQPGPGSPIAAVFPAVAGILGSAGVVSVGVAGCCAGAGCGSDATGEGGGSGAAAVSSVSVGAVRSAVPLGSAAGAGVSAGAAGAAAGGREPGQPRTVLFTGREICLRP